SERILSTGALTQIERFLAQFSQSYQAILLTAAQFPVRPSAWPDFWCLSRSDLSVLILSEVIEAETSPDRRRVQFTYDSAAIADFLDTLATESTLPPAQRQTLIDVKQQLAPSTPTAQS
ncbi:hypothetical protein, partial [Haemophilus parainfluenzae]|uniref:hypothetical protein n=1 Tax=Haemophilus parainfluenzae TaxID=729 RepID=UPI001788E6C6